MLRSFHLLQHVSTISLASIANESIEHLQFMNNFENIITPLKKHVFYLEPLSKKYSILYFFIIYIYSYFDLLGILFCLIVLAGK